MTATFLSRFCEVCLVKGPNQTRRITERLNRGMATQKDIEDLMRIVRVFPMIFISVIIMSFIFGGWVMSLQISVSRNADDLKDHTVQLKEVRDLFYKIDKKLPDSK